MKILFFRGSFSSDAKNFNHGLVCFCHFDSTDTQDNVKRAITKIQSRRTPEQGTYRNPIDEEKVILVPFSCLDDRSTIMPFEEASDCFRQLAQGIPNAIVTPFASFNDLVLKVTSFNRYIKFIKI